MLQTSHVTRIQFLTILQSPFVTSGIRLGTAAVTTRGFNTEDMDVVAEAIALLVDDVEKNQAKAMELVKGLTDKYPLYE